MIDVNEERGLLGVNGGEQSGDEGEEEWSAAEHDHHSNPQLKRPEL
jgi:hypothetical protein